MHTDSKKHDTPTDANNVLADVLFYEKPQERKNDGIIEFEKNGQKYLEKKIYSEPCKRCENCPVYRVDKSVTPTAYYCQAGFLFGIFNKAIKENAIPENCRVVEVRVSGIVPLTSAGIFSADFKNKNYELDKKII